MPQSRCRQGALVPGGLTESAESASEVAHSRGCREVLSPSPLGSVILWGISRYSGYSDDHGYDLRQQNGTKLNEQKKGSQGDVWRNQEQAWKSSLPVGSHRVCCLPR